MYSEKIKLTKCGLGCIVRMCVLVFLYKLMLQ